MTGSGLPERPVVAGLYHLVPLGPDRVQVANAGRSVVLSGAGFAERLASLFAALDGHSTVEELRQRFPGLVPGVLEALHDKHLLAAGDPDDDPVHGRPLAAALALLGRLSPAAAAARLSASTVAVSGCGPVGAAVAVDLAQAGVGRLLLADGEPVTAADAAALRVAAGTHAGEGPSRAEAVRRLCIGAGTAPAEVVTRPLAPEVVRDATLVVVEAEYRTEGAAGDADAALAGGRPYLLHGQDGLEAVVGPLVGPGGGPCHCCAEARRLSHVARLEEHLAYRRHRAATAPRADAFLSAHTSIVAGVVTSEVLRGLLDAEPRTRGAAVVVDLDGLTMATEPVLAVPGCPACAFPGGPDVTAG